MIVKKAIFQYEDVTRICELDEEATRVLREAMGYPNDPYIKDPKAMFKVFDSIKAPDFLGYWIAETEYRTSIISFNCNWLDIHNKPYAVYRVRIEKNSINERLMQ